MRALSWAYLAVAYAFVFLPVVVLVAFSFQDGRLPVPPFQGFTLDWYGRVLGERDLMEALVNSALVAAVLSPLAAWLLGQPQLMALTIVLALIILERHKANIRRLLAGQEPRIGKK